jgi:hypothetical protein
LLDYLAIAASDTYASPSLCPSENGDITTVPGQTIQACAISDGTLQVLAENNGLGPNIASSVINATHEGSSGISVASGLRVSSLTFYSGEGVATGSASVDTFTNIGTLSGPSNGIELRASSISSGFQPSHLEIGTSSASIGTLNNNGQIADPAA